MSSAVLSVAPDILKVNTVKEHFTNWFRLLFTLSRKSFKESYANYIVVLKPQTIKVLGG